jgi:hypothetical protein
MTGRSILYWLISLAFAVLVARAAEPAAVADGLTWMKVEAASAHVLPVPEPGRAMMLFAGVMAMAFTYRRAWLNWKTVPKA